MPDISNYTADIRLILGEAGKYFALLVFSVLAIRLWRRWMKVLAARNLNGLLCAVASTILAVVVGYVSICQSLNSLYSHYGMKAFRSGRLPQALSLFDTAEHNWRNADAVGQRGVCLLLLGKPDKGLALIEQARTMRKGKGTSFENFYEGLYDFNNGDVDAAIPLLQAAGTDDTYRWSVIKIFAVMELDVGRVADVTEQMKPFMQADVTEFDQAYIMAALKLEDGKKAEAQVLLDKFPESELSPRWKNRFEKLRARLGN